MRRIACTTLLVTLAAAGLSAFRFPQDPSPVPVRHTVTAGDTLSSIAQRVYGSARWWPQLWRQNRSLVRDPGLITPGMRLRVTARWRNAPRMPAAPAPKRAVAAPAPVALAAAPAPAPAAPATVVAAGGYQACVIQRESGGDPAAVNPSSGAGGLYGFLPSTWQGLGYPGLPEDAPVAEQNAAFQQLYAQSGSAPWATDGC